MIMKIGRNDMCSCGSNIKYKKCHLPIVMSEKKSYKPKVDGINQETINDMKKISNDIGNDLDLDVVVLSNVGVDTDKEIKTFTINLSNEIGFINLKPSPEGLDKHIVSINNILIREKYRGNGIGTKWLQSIIDSLYKYGYGVMLQPCCIDYCEETYRGNVKNLNSKNMSLLPDRVYENYKITLLEQINRYETTPQHKRIRLFKENSKKLVEWYSKFGFVQFDSEIPYMFNFHKKEIN